MGDAKRQITPLPAAASQTIDQQGQQGMKPQFSIAEMADAKELQRPLIDRVKTDALVGVSVTAEAQRS